MPEEMNDPEVVLYQCLDDGLCGALFARPQSVLMYGEDIEACPECHGHDFSPIPNEVVWTLFWHIVSHEFTEEEWDTYRMVAQSGMPPMIQPLSDDD